MPIYVYEATEPRDCKRCSKPFEVLQGVNDTPIQDCPLCGRSVKKVVGDSVSVAFVGEGFHVNDYGKS